jgi:hypothetical protein
MCSSDLPQPPAEIVDEMEEMANRLRMIARYVADIEAEWYRTEPPMSRQTGLGRIFNILQNKNTSTTDRETMEQILRELRSRKSAEENELFSDYFMTHIAHFARDPSFIQLVTMSRD